MSHNNEYDSKNDVPCLDALKINSAEIPCERKRGHTKDHQADVRDAQGQMITVQWRSARAKD